MPEHAPADWCLVHLGHDGVRRYCGGMSRRDDISSARMLEPPYTSMLEDAIAI